MRGYAYLVLACLAVAARAEAQVRVFVPFVFQPYSSFSTPDQVCTVTRFWESSTSVFNNSATPATYRFVRVYGKGSIYPAPDCSVAHPLAPFSGEGVIRIGDCFLPKVFGPAFIEMEVSPSVVVNNVVEKLDAYGSYQSTNGGDLLSQGRVSYPPFRELLPAGSEAVCGEIEVFQTPSLPCESNLAYPRRVNVTLFNAGKDTATFTVKVRQLRTSTVMFSASYTVAAEDVIQINRIPTPVDVSNPLSLDYNSARVWISISADQPFLAYASSIFENGEPGSFPMEVFPARLAGP